MQINRFLPLSFILLAVQFLPLVSDGPLHSQVLPATPSATPDVRAQVLPSITPTPTPGAGMQALPQTPDLSPTPTPDAGMQALPQTPDLSPTPVPYRERAADHCGGANTDTDADAPRDSPKPEC